MDDVYVFCDDLGGGLGITYDREEPPHPKEYAEAIKKELDMKDLTLILEPGRVIMGNAGILVTKVLYTKSAQGKTFIVVTHDDRFAKLTTRTMRILDGRIVSLHKAKRIRKTIEKDEQLIEREEFIFVDEHGNLRLPEEIRKKTGIKNYIKIEIRDGVASLIPREKDE